MGVALMTFPQATVPPFLSPSFFFSLSPFPSFLSSFHLFVGNFYWNVLSKMKAHALIYSRRRIRICGMNEERFLSVLEGSPAQQGEGWEAGRPIRRLLPPCQQEMIRAWTLGREGRRKLRSSRAVRCRGLGYRFVGEREVYIKARRAERRENFCPQWTV